MTHEEICERLSAGEQTDAVRAHVARCKGCRSWADALDRVRTIAPTMFEEAPVTLAGRVLEAVKTTVEPVAPVRWWRRVGGRAAIAAGIAAAVAAGALTLPDGKDPVLVAAAKKTQGARTARVELTSSFSLTRDDPIDLPVPDLGRVRAGLRRDFPALGRAMESIPEPPKPRPLRKVSSTARATGGVVFPDRIHLVGRGTETNEVEGKISGRYETIIVGDQVWISTPLFGKKWLRMGRFGVDVSWDFNPGHLLEMVRRSGGNAEAGAETTLDGERVVRYRFTDTKDLGDFIGRRSVQIDAWVGVEDGFVRRLRERHTGDGRLGRLRAVTDVRFHDFGADVSVSPPPKEDELTMDDALQGFFGLVFGTVGAAFQISFEAAATMPEFAFPNVEFPDFKFPEFTLPELRLPELRLPDFDFDFDLPEPRFPSFPQPSARASAEAEASTGG